jgi:hypothetical protein
MVMSARSLEGLQVMMSMSNSPDLGALRMGERHFDEAFKEIIRHLLAEGATLAYGGDLRTQGFTRMLFDLARTYNAAEPQGGTTKIKNYLACTVWEKDGEREQVRLKIRRDYAGAADLICLPPPDRVRDEIGRATYDFKDEPEAAALTDMRQKIIGDSHAVVFLGGRLTGYRGKYPGVLEEVALSLVQGHSLYLLGGFGGCTADAAGALIGTSPIVPEKRRLDQEYRPDYHQAIEALRQFEGRMPDNGLSRSDNRMLATTPEISVIIPLLLRGLRTLSRS